MRLGAFNNKRSRHPPCGRKRGELEGKHVTFRFLGSLAPPLEIHSFVMATAKLPYNDIQRLCDQHPKPANVIFQYGTAGFRTMYVFTSRGATISNSVTRQRNSPRVRLVQGGYSGCPSEQKVRWEDHRCHGHSLPQP
jgi:hypothetical protein